MVDNTDLSREFGSYECAQQEFGSKVAALDPKTDLSPEFSHLPDTEFGSVNPKQEFSHDTATDAAKRPSRRERHRRTLLLQMAAVALATVLVTSSFGQDILGDDLLFSGTAAPTEPTSESAVPDSNASETITITRDWEDSHHVIYTNAANNGIISLYDDTFRYDPDSYTVYLRGCSLNRLDISVSRDITIYVEEDSSLGHLRSDYCGIILDGEPGAVLEINKHSAEDKNVWFNGITQQYGNSSLTVMSGIVVDVYGGSSGYAINILRTAASPAIRYDASQTTMTGTLRSDDFNCWTIVDEAGEPAQFVRFAPVGYEPPDSGYDTQEYIIVNEADNQYGYNLIGGTPPEGGVISRGTFRYDYNTRTLYLRGCDLYSLSIHVKDSITIYVEKDSSVGNLNLYQLYNTSVILDGVPGAVLEINSDNNHAFGISMVGTGGNASLTVNPGIIVEVSGGSTCAVGIVRSAASPAICYDESQTAVTGTVKSGDFDFRRNLGNPDSNSDFPEWTIVGEAGEPARFVRFAPIGYEPPYSGDNSDWNITVRETGATNSYSLAPEAAENGIIDLGTIRYNANSRTLYLKGCDLEYLGIQVEDSITIYVEKDSSVGHLVSEHGTSVILDGVPGAVLEIDSNNRWLFGIHMYGTGGNTVLRVEPGIIVEVSGGTRGAIGVGGTTASPAIYYPRSQSTATGTVQSGDFDLFRNTSLYADLPEWTVVDETGEPAQFVRFAPIGYEPPETE